MYISISQIQYSLSNLQKYHPFYGISFLVAKLGQLPVGSTIEFQFDGEERNFLDSFYKPASDSTYYYRIFRPSDKSKEWLEAKYPSSGSQSTRTRGAFSVAFIHERDTDIWGWKEKYIDILSKTPAFRRSGPIPAFDLAVWLFREFEWPSHTTGESILNKFLDTFHINNDEKDLLFDLSTNTVDSFLADTKVSWDLLSTFINSPPDAMPEEGGILAYLKLRGIGPAKELEIEPAKRINILTGDNGLGKTFILDCAWWALSGQWADVPAYPRLDAKPKEPQISFQIAGEKKASEIQRTQYNWEEQNWKSDPDRPTIPGLLIYARVDGSFAVWDPYKSSLYSNIRDENLGFLTFTKSQVWNGLEKEISGKSRVLCNGLLRDWITWQNKPERYPFATFANVLELLSPPKSDLGTLRPGEPTRLPYDAREIPTIRHSYGEVPIIHTSAGVQRIVALAYLIVWAWKSIKFKQR